MLLLVPSGARAELPAALHFVDVGGTCPAAAEVAALLSRAGPGAASLAYTPAAEWPLLPFWLLSSGADIAVVGRESNGDKVVPYIFGLRLTADGGLRLMFA